MIKYELQLGGENMSISFRHNDYMYSYSKGIVPELRMHMHNYYEFLYFKKGKAVYHVENNVYSVEEGDLFITRPDELHTISFLSDDDYERHIIQISDNFLSDIGFDMLELIKSRKAGTLNRIDAKTVKSYGLEKYFLSVEQYCINRVPESDVMVKTFIIQMLAKINSFMREYENMTYELPYKDSRVMDIKNFIDEHITENLTLDSICEHFFITKYYLCHMFKKYSGMTVNEYISMRRLLVAKQMIFAGQNITDLCYKCGFKNYSSFYKSFKKLTGKTPSEFFSKPHEADAV